MKRFSFVVAALLFAANVNAQNNEVVYDTTKYEVLNEVVVGGVRVQKNAPFSVTLCRNPGDDLCDRQGPL